jgi:hypothetical protein
VSFAKDLEGTGVTVNILVPGLTPRSGGAQSNRCRGRAFAQAVGPVEIRVGVERAVKAP